MFLALLPPSPLVTINTHPFNYHLGAENSQALLLGRGRTVYSFPWVVSLGFRHTLNTSSRVSHGPVIVNISPSLSLPYQSPPWCHIQPADQAEPQKSSLKCLVSCLPQPSLSLPKLISYLSYFYHVCPGSYLIISHLYQPLNLPSCLSS